jgi:ubiquinone/menaquinone biosynthesis C-methylase UbiE
MNRTRDAYDRWSSAYDGDPNPQTVLEEASVVELVSPSPGDRILDAACGTGRYCRLFRERGADVVGVDFSEGMLGVARSRLPGVEFHWADLASSLPFPDGDFNKVNCAQALKHLPDVCRALREFSRVLRAGGTLTFSVTHPEMNWAGYELSFSPSFVLSAESDIYPHRFCDYFEAIATAGLRVADFRQMPVGERIRQYLTAESYEQVKGRYQIAVFHLVRPAVGRSGALEAGDAVPA